MCISADTLVCKDKIVCSACGTTGSIVFSGVGHISTPITHLGILIKTEGFYTLELRREATIFQTHTAESIQSITKQGTGSFEFCILKDLDIKSPNVYSLVYTSTDPISIHEINLATRCLC